jgi:uncharacterized membrane protein YsdA (DUF1294 family)
MLAPVSLSLPWIVAALVAMNLWTFLAFWQDKQRARAGGWRISEDNLLGLAFAGGWPAALLARHLFRHKTRKEPFSSYLQLIAMLEGGAALGLAFVYG